ncbi:probable pleckstrin homology domain-containing family N member 1 isoform X3 [Denticeps clupeoides]|uniref:probable pleckstrin homology domain-containing family N member 1 isoform X3 n=1 Tax=Denticeps clupeoides TaxID=299321 RepID=UPI0010A2ED5D|nr:pleckstrin homology domain-containing family N member 1 isoform X3 [Denticeps clupeoides]
MGSSMSCVPERNLSFSRKSFIRRNSRLFRKKNPQEGQEKSNSIINILSTVTPWKEMSPKDLQTIENMKWDPPFPYDPASGWKKSSVNVKNYGRLIHSSKVRFRFLHRPDVHDCFLDLFQTHLHFVSNTCSLTYQGTLPLKEITISKLQSNYNQPQEFAFQISGVSLNSIIVYCTSQKDMENWFSLLKQQIEVNGGTPIAPGSYTETKCGEEGGEGGEELRNSISNEPIYEWEGSQRESLGPIVYVTKVKLQHLPCQEQSDRLLVMYPDTMIFLSEENHRLFYKGKLPLNMITVTTPCQDVKPNTFMIEGKLINPIIVTCLDRAEFHDWIQHFKSSDVPILIPPPPVYDIIYTPTQREAPELDRWSNNSRSRTSSVRQSHSGRGSRELQVPHIEDNPLSPGYTEPLCFASSRPPSMEVQSLMGLGSRTNSMSSHGRPHPELRPLSRPGSSSLRSSHASSEGPLSPIYSTPYTSAMRSGPVQHVEKAPLIKSNSWSTPQSSLRYPHLNTQRHSDMYSSRKPLSPLYDDPSTPGVQHLPGSHMKLEQQSWQSCAEQQCPPLVLKAPPPGRKNRNSLVQDQDIQAPDWASERRADAVSRLKLLPGPQHGRLTQDIFPSRLATDAEQITYSYLPDDNSYLRPAEPDDQEVDYDNIWEYDSASGMIQPRSRILPHRTAELEFAAPGLGAVATRQRWS